MIRSLLSSFIRWHANFFFTGTLVQKTDAKPTLVHLSSATFSDDACLRFEAFVLPFGIAGAAPAIPAIQRFWQLFTATETLRILLPMKRLQQETKTTRFLYWRIRTGCSACSRHSQIMTGNLLLCMKRKDTWRLTGEKLKGRAACSGIERVLSLRG